MYCLVGIVLLSQVVCGVASSGSPRGSLVYSNVVDPVMYRYGADPGDYVSDDIELSAEAGALMDSYELLVFGDGGGTFDVEVDLWSDDPCGEPSLISGTEATFANLPADSTRWLLTVTFDLPIRIPATLWMRTTFSIDDSGWVLADEAELGFTYDALWIDEPDECGVYWGGTYAGFWARITGQIVGDANCDESVDNFDIDAFVLALTSTPPDCPEYYAEYPDCDHTLADVNGDGSVNNFDIDPFVELITGK